MQRVISVYENIVLEFLEKFKKEEPEAYADNAQEIQTYIGYVENSWLGVAFGSTIRRRQPIFPLTGWIHYEDVLAGDSITNNSCEGYHSGWTGSLSQRPTLYTVIEAFIQKDSWAEQILREDSVGVGGNALEATKSRSLQREQQRLDLQVFPICKF